jgi:hypothetical protein
MGWLLLVGKLGATRAERIISGGIIATATACALVALWCLLATLGFV